MGSILNLVRNARVRQRIKQAYLVQHPTGLLMDWSREVHFLHIGKCAGSQIRAVIARLSADPELPIRAHGHAIKLHHLPGRPRYFFSIRKPESRFVSAFYSRKNQGLPLRLHPWHGPETVAFGRFQHANDLAEALFAPGADGAAALQAMKAIHHLNDDQIDWFLMRADLFWAYAPLAILRQEHLQADLGALLVKLGVPDRAETLLADTGEMRNATDGMDKPPLSPLARENLARWYAQDSAFYAVCEHWIAERQAMA